MSQEIRGHPQALIDAEKGTLDTLPVSLSHSKDVKPPPSDVPLPSKEKDAGVTTTTQEVILSEKPTEVRCLLHSIQYDPRLSRKFFTFTFGLNMIGLVLAASGHFPYGVKYSGTIVVANFNFAILMRNEVFGRFLYLFVNTQWPPLWFRLGCTSVLQVRHQRHCGQCSADMYHSILAVFTAAAHSLGLFGFCSKSSTIFGSSMSLMTPSW